MPQQQREPERRHERAEAHEQPRPVAVGERAEARDSANITSVGGIIARPASQRAVAGDLLQEQHQEEEQ